MKKKFTTLVVTMLLVAGLFVATTDPGQKYFLIAKNLDIFATMYKEVNSLYVDEINPTDFVKTGIDAMLSSLDPYTNYIPEDQIENYRTMTTGQYGGIGAVIGRRNSDNLVIMPYEGYPAHNAGLKIGDVLLEIDEKDVTEKTTDQISELLKGQSGTEVTLKIKRPGDPAPKTLHLKREKIKIDNVPYHGMLTNDIGYVQLTDFTAGSSGDVQKALQELRRNGAAKFVFDLRSNPGGLLTEAVNISNLFIPKGQEVVSTRGRVTDWNKTYHTLNQPFDTEVPLVVLINGKSASASEIVSGTVQDYDRGVVVGQRSFGKGLVQATRPLTYNSQLKITTAKYHIPSGRCIQELDYSHKTNNGTATKIADSLRATFYTQNKRPVKDGAGIKPDIVVEEPNYAPITQSLVIKNLLFDYATLYAIAHDTIAQPNTFAITEAEYEKFVAWLSDKDYDYETRVEQTLNHLERYAKKEKYFDAIENELENLKARVKHNKDKDLQKHKAEIKELLEQEIVSRYYLQKGQKIASFDTDPDVQVAIDVLNDTARYHAILKGINAEK